jgi:hypothetical protein
VVSSVSTENSECWWFWKLLSPFEKGCTECCNAFLLKFKFLLFSYIYISSRQNHFKFMQHCSAADAFSRRF